MKASIIIRCFNEERHIGRLLHGITHQDFDEPYQVVVVDSGSTDRTLNVVAKYNTTLVSIPSEEFSFGRALNLGIEAARGEYTVHVSAHVWPRHRYWLRSLLKPFANARVAAAYGRQRGGPETRYSEHQTFARWYPEESIPIQDTPFCNNANCAIRRSLWEEVPYNEQLTGLEDLAWAKTVCDRGFYVSYVADAEVVHIHEETPLQIRNRYRREAIALKQIYPEQHMTWRNFLRLFSQNALTDYAHAISEGQLLANVRDIATFRFNQFLGAYQGMRQTGPTHQRLKRTFYYPRRLPHGYNGTAPAPAAGADEVDYRAFEIESHELD